MCIDHCLTCCSTCCSLYLFYLIWWIKGVHPLPRWHEVARTLCHFGSRSIQTGQFDLPPSPPWLSGVGWEPTHSFTCHALTSSFLRLRSMQHSLRAMWLCAGSSRCARYCAGAAARDLGCSWCAWVKWWSGHVSGDSFWFAMILFSIYVFDQFRLWSSGPWISVISTGLRSRGISSRVCHFIWWIDQRTEPCDWSTPRSTHVAGERKGALHAVRL